MKWLKQIIKFLIEDTKSDIKFVKQVIKGENKSKYTLKEFLNINIGVILKNYWLWYLLIILSLALGYYLATQNLQDACNQHIINTFIPKNPRLGLMNFTI